MWRSCVHDSAKVVEVQLARQVAEGREAGFSTRQDPAADGDGIGAVELGLNHTAEFRSTHDRLLEEQLHQAISAGFVGMALEISRGDRSASLRRRDRGEPLFDDRPLIVAHASAPLR